MSEDNYIEELYAQFKADVSQGLSMVHYDSDELLEVYDYATDVYDDYVRLQALILGSRDYPLDRRFKERKAYYLYDSGDTEGARQVLSEIKAASFLKLLLEIRLAERDEKSDADRLNALLSRQRKGALDDEAVIKLIETAAELKMYDWLVMRYDTIKQCAEYPDTVMYELSDVFEQGGRYADAVHMLEDLTAEQPLSEEYWLLLAELYSEHMNMPDKAIEAVDNALAINSHSFNGLLLRARILAESADTLDEALKITDALTEKKPDSIQALFLKEGILSGLGRKEEAVGILRKYLQLFPDNAAVMERMVELADDASCFTDVLAFLKANPGFGDSEWLLGITGSFIQTRSLGAAAAVLYGAFLNNVPIPPTGIELMAEMLYRAKMYKEVCEIYDSAVSQVGYVPTPQLNLLRALSLVRMDSREEAGKFIGKILADGFGSSDNMYIQQLVDVGCSYFFLQLRDFLDGKLPYEACDPFITDAKDMD
ncbi:MAG: tetratricopeptide repeat protein [Muribaculaceae bacterium]|nr:tetratricopeptide repeat protein [Muribaculaceae bacterium]